MKVGTDGVLLGAWTDPTFANSILDVGTGTGLIALMLAQKSEAAIDAIDIDPNACLQADENFSNSPWQKKFRIIHQSIQQYSECCNKKYDLIVSNPPYFDGSYKASDLARTIARHHAASLSFDELIQCSKKLLTVNGILNLILPFHEGCLFIQQALKNKLFLKNETRVLTRKGKLPKRLLLSFSQVSNKPVSSELVIQNEDAAFSEEYVTLTGDYYLGLKSHRRH
ncbi:MAG: methyltransferase [Bacteroidia bacterium]|nr:methyltransferase [Bacteroidia bacterium]